MAKKTNGHVERLHRYLPFSSSHDQIYDEYQRSDDALNLETCALHYLVGAVKRGARLVILTGDAGHGKTHLCRRLLEQYLGYSQDEARNLIKNSCDGSKLIGSRQETDFEIPLRIYKDFSEISNVDIASEHIERAMLTENEIAVICANEGRLRAVLENGREKESSKRLFKQFSDSFKDGLASKDGRVHIINLNYQSVASNKQQSLLKMALKSWVSGNRWKVCQDCDSSTGCPILLNRNFLSENQPAKSQSRQDRVELLFATVERLGTVVTIREILMTIAYLLTGGLRCSDVHKKSTKHKKGWQNKYAFYNSIFLPPTEINHDKLKKIPVLNVFSQLDPGLRSIRAVDEKLINEQGVFDSNSLDLIFECKVNNEYVYVDSSNGIDEIIVNPLNRKERTSEARFIQEVVQSLRRKLFFENDLVSGSVMFCLGFEYGDEFLEVLAGGMAPTRMKAVKNRIVSGLHTIQGLQMGTKETTLHVVDPSFANTGSHAAIIARRIPTTAIKILPMSESWDIDSDFAGREICNTVDWLDRYIVLRVENDDGKKLEFPINLMVFDCIARAGSGYVAKEFYAHDLRRIKTFLGSLVRNQPPEDGNISLFIHGRTHYISIDDGVIQVGGGH